ncbi:MAG: hypothetical protein U0Q15_17665 [Kineosporiaceae bacterium]
MRVYLPTTASRLAAAVAAGEVDAPVHAVTPAVREWYVEGDQEELEFAALTEAAQGSLRLLAEGGPEPDPARRLVLAADVDDASVGTWPDAPHRSLARLLRPVPWRRVVSLHVDEDAAQDAVRAAIAALPAADAGDDDALFLLDEAGACDLLWYDVTEVDEVLRDLRHTR